jgi:hypothetical protein
VLHYVRLGVFSAMVNSLGDKNRAAVGEYTSVRIPAPIKRRLEQAAGANRKSLSAEIVARLAQSFDMAAPIEPSAPIASETARAALRRVRVVEDALRVLGSNDCYVDILNEPAQKLLAEILDKLPPKGT